MARSQGGSKQELRVARAERRTAAYTAAGRVLRRGIGGGCAGAAVGWGWGVTGRQTRWEAARQVTGPWNDSEIAFVFKNLSQLNSAEMGKELGRPAASVRGLLASYGLRTYLRAPAPPEPIGIQLRTLLQSLRRRRSQR